MNAIAKMQLDAYRVRLQKGEQLTIAEQRQLVEFVAEERRQGEGNLNALVTAREAYDRILNMPDDHETYLSADFLRLLTALGVALGHGAGG